MRRREFCFGLGAGVVALVGKHWGRSALASGIPTTVPNVDPRSGYTPTPPGQFLFTDLRHINPGDVGWVLPEGAHVPDTGAADPPVRAIADTQSVARGVRLVAQRATKEGPIQDLPRHLIHDGDLYRSWQLKPNYPPGTDRGVSTTSPAQSLTVRYGESKDGYSWAWRDVSEIPVSDITGIDGITFFVDPHGLESERYKCLYCAKVLSGLPALWAEYEKVHPRHRDVRLRPDYLYCLFGLVSPDGVRWRPIPQHLMIHKSDTDTAVYYDEWLGKYVLYTRLYWLNRRMIARAESDDWRHWTPVDPIIWPSLDEPFSWDVYLNGRTSYPGLPEHHLMFPLFYRRLTQSSEVHLLSSQDGIRWDRVPGGPVLVPGDPGSWDGEFIGAGRHLVPLGKDRIAIPYFGSNLPHKYPQGAGPKEQGTGFASWPKGRLVALTADEEGSFHTFGVQVTGQELRLNARIRRAGEIRVGLDGTKGRSATDCDPIFGDSAAHTIRWRGDPRLSVPPGKTVSLHFRLRAAELFGFEWV
jgi:hypothetical protein